MFKRFLCWWKGHVREPWREVGGFPVFKRGQVAKFFIVEARSSRCLRCNRTV